MLHMRGRVIGAGHLHAIDKNCGAAPGIMHNAIEVSGLQRSRDLGRKAARGPRAIDNRNLKTQSVRSEFRRHVACPIITRKIEKRSGLIAQPLSDQSRKIATIAASDVHRTKTRLPGSFCRLRSDREAIDG